MCAREGKSLIYNVPVFSSILQHPLSTALYIFPTKVGTLLKERKSIENSNIL